MIPLATLEPLADRYVGLRGLAAYSGLSVRTLRGRLRHRTMPLPHFRLEGKVLVKVSEFDRWLARFRRPGPDATDTVDAAVDELLGRLEEVRA